MFCKIKDSFQEKKVQVMARNIVGIIEDKAENWLSLDLYSRFVRRMVMTNPVFEDVMRDNPIFSEKIIQALQELLDKFEDLDFKSVKPTNYAYLEQNKKKLIHHINFFTKLQQEQEFERVRDTDDEAISQPYQSEYTRGQQVRFYDQNQKRYVRGVVENIYENFLKVRVVLQNGMHQYEWFEDSSEDI
eukprot:CAMPEP_0114602928 /NCGR_PEP_ID=MMETSP0125-20121206/25440_1 /TAXON_ID=485358 ORGANISM="Aristerostoma sp., Strain ATCC 50986" /NCGR_SAMPLE_ID=MMETSP0125 /ASSEMBLY_ACC=CAM_ASM_000245 /LENGTH=187 /DNA_ID=CAMNT_0001813433 /DNA_START=5162 /DNA_END=5725 /DNA_ORIENTATION=+